jgi:flagellar basal body-associated protein FliL
MVELNPVKTKLVATIVISLLVVLGLTGVVYAAGYAGFGESGGQSDGEDRATASAAEPRASQDQGFTANVSCDDLDSEDARALYDC